MRFTVFLRRWLKIFNETKGHTNNDDERGDHV